MKDKTEYNDDFKELLHRIFKLEKKYNFYRNYYLDNFEDESTKKKFAFNEQYTPKLDKSPLSNITTLENIYKDLTNMLDHIKIEIIRNSGYSENIRTYFTHNELYYNTALLNNDKIAVSLFDILDSEDFFR